MTIKLKPFHRVALTMIGGSMAFVLLYALLLLASDAAKADPRSRVNVEYKTVGGMDYAVFHYSGTGLYVVNLDKERLEIEDLQRSIKNKTR